MSNQSASHSREMIRRLAEAIARLIEAGRAEDAIQVTRRAMAVEVRRRLARLLDHSRNPR